jgi:replicative DNA helicase
MTKENLEVLKNKVKARKAFILNEGDSKILINDKLPPEELRLEEHVLGNMIDSIPTFCELIEEVTDGFFIESRNQKVIAALTEIFTYAGKPNITTITSELKKSGEFNSVGGLSYLEYLANKKES